MESLQARIEECMRRHPHLSQAEIARATGVKTPSVSGWLKGSTMSLKPEPARKGSILFGCDQNWLATGIGQPNWTAPGSTVKDSLTVQPPQAPADLVAQLAAALLAAPEAQRDELAQVLALLAKTGSPLYQRRLAELLAAPAPAPTSVSPSKKAA